MNEQDVSILIAVGDSAQRGFLVKTLARAGYRRVVAVASGPEALAAMEKGVFALVIAGGRLAGMTEYDLCRAIRARRAGAYVYILILARGRCKSPVLEEIGRAHV